MFGDLVLSYETASPIGIRYPDGVVDLNAPDDHVLVAGDSVVIVTNSLADLVLHREPIKPAPTATSVAHGALSSGSILLVGWNPMAPRILIELEKWASPAPLCVCSSTGAWSPKRRSAFRASRSFSLR